MATVDLSKTRNNLDSNGMPINPKNGLPMFDSARIFLAGKITDHIGGFAHFTYSNYDHQNGDGQWQGRWGSDNTDFRFVDSIIGDSSDLILGLTLHNNPAVQDVWNSAPAWSYPYISSTISPVTNTSKSSAAHDTPARLEACLTLQFELLLGGPYTYPGPVKVAGDIDAQPEMCQDMTTAHKDVGVSGCVFDQFMVDLVATLQSKLPAADFAALTSTTNGTYPLTATNSAGIPVGTKFQFSAVPTLFNLRSTIIRATPGGPLYLPPTVATSYSG
ncbi:hypothetical protein [Paraburkholderia fungorum]|uniref:hypothetical protein n=1 Tax=Paraburkholderia fungorum TaxID=134537 RepID=UPI00241E00BB|nr:hypothetical protein [Paraburkholderia fungorum]